MDKNLQKRFPQNIDVNNNGTLRLRITWKGKRVFTLAQGDPHSKGDINYLVELRDKIKAKLKAGQSIEEYRAVEKADYLQNVDRPFFEVAQNYLDTADIAKTTRSEYVRDINRYWMPHFHDLTLPQITRRKITDVMVCKFARTNPSTGRVCKPTAELSGKSKENAMVPLREIFDFEGFTGERDIARQVTFKLGQASERFRYTPDERDLILSALPPGDVKAWFALFFGCGLRPSEMLGLMWFDIGADREYLRIERAVVRGIKKSVKNCKARRVVVPDWVRPYFDDIPKRSEYVFGIGQGQYRTKTKRYSTEWQKAHVATGLEYREPYTCRHTRASELLSIGAAPSLAAIQLGHSVEMFNKIYARFIEEFCSDLSIFNTPGPSVAKPAKSRKVKK